MAKKRNTSNHSVKKAEKYEPLTLKYPIENGDGKKIETLKFHPMKAKVLRELPRGSVTEDGSVDPASVIPLIAASARISVEEADEIDLRDMDNVVKKMDPFLPGSLQIGKK